MTKVKPAEILYAYPIERFAPGMLISSADPLTLICTYPVKVFQLAVLG